jgi:hypothetical protein
MHIRQHSTCRVLRTLLLFFIKKFLNCLGKLGKVYGPHQPGAAGAVGVGTFSVHVQGANDVRCLVGGNGSYHSCQRLLSGTTPGCASVASLLLLKINWLFLSIRMCFSGFIFLRQGNYLVYIILMFYLYFYIFCVFSFRFASLRGYLVGLLRLHH